MLWLPTNPKRDVVQKFLSSAFIMLIISKYEYAMVNALSSSSRLKLQMQAGVGQQDLSTISSTRRNRLSQALSSPVQGKLSISPEISIQESVDPTSLLLQTTHINHLSESLRARAKANAVFWSTSTTSSSSTSLDSLKQFEEEQQTAHGKIPSPIPIIYCCPTTIAATTVNSDLLAKISSLGVCGILVPLKDGTEISNMEELLALHQDDNDSLVVHHHSIYENALSHGLHAIPEIILHPKSSWTESDVESLVSTLKTKFGFRDPVAIVFTFGSSSSSSSFTKNDNNKNHNNEEEITSLPIVKLPAKHQLGGTLILGSVRAPVGGGEGDAELHNQVAKLKAAGFSGVILRSDCVPYLGSSNLEFLTKFWCSVITQLKSVRSKAFGGFRTKNQLDENAGANAWAKYTSKLLDEGVLPSSTPETSTSNDLNTDRGDYKGF